MFFFHRRCSQIKARFRNTILWCIPSVCGRRYSLCEWDGRKAWDAIQAEGIANTYKIVFDSINID